MTRAEISQAVAKALAYADAGKIGAAREWEAIASQRIREYVDECESDA